MRVATASGARALFRDSALHAPAAFGSAFRRSVACAAYAHDAGAPSPPPRQFPNAGPWGFAAVAALTMTVVWAWGAWASPNARANEVAASSGMHVISRGAAAGALGVSSKGDSSSWKAQHTNVLRIFEEFREYNNEYKSESRSAKHGNPPARSPADPSSTTWAWLWAWRRKSGKCAARTTRRTSSRAWTWQSVPACP